ncbi:MAG: type I methionyl aminopeptidase [Polyangiaceae bacterium]
MLRILSADEIVAMREAGRVAAATLAWVGAQLKPGMTTARIDQLVREDTRRRGGKPSQLGYQGFPAAVCTSRNQVVCHGIPHPQERLEEGDIVNIDVTTLFNGFHGDTSKTFTVGRAGAEAEHVVRVAREARDIGIRSVRAGSMLGDIGIGLESITELEGWSVVRDLGGHGIGRVMHQEPHVPHFGKAGTGLRLKAGMAITIEPMVNLGTHEVVQLEDGWTIVTADGRLSAQFEHTLVVTEMGCEIMTLEP